MYVGGCCAAFSGCRLTALIHTHQWQKERRAERRAKEWKVREANLQKMYDQLRASIEGRATKLALDFIKSKEGQAEIKMERLPVRHPRDPVSPVCVVDCTHPW